MQRYLVTWLDENGEDILSFYCYFKNNSPYDVDRVGESDYVERKESTPFLDPACTVSLGDVDLCSAVHPVDSRVVLAP